MSSLNNTPPSHRTALSVNNKRVIFLDIVRIILALWILLYHSIIHLHCDYGFLNVILIHQTIPMTLFFMLSGYSLQMVYGNKSMDDGKAVKNFFFKRLISIWPLYMVCTILIIIMNVGAGQQSIIDNFILFPIEVLGIQSLFPGSLFNYASNSGTWFISCLFLGYAMFPILMRIVDCKWKIRGKVLLLVILLALWIYISFVGRKYDVQFMYTNPLMRLLEFFIGMSLANIVVLRLSEVSIYYKPLVYFSNLAFALYLGQGFVLLPLKYCLKNNLLPSGLSNILLISVVITSAYIVAIILHEEVEKPSKQVLTKYLTSVRNR